MRVCEREREQSYQMRAANRAVLVKACAARRSTSQGLRGCIVSLWSWLREDWGVVPCSDFSGLQALAKRESPVFQPLGKAKPSLRQSQSSPARSRLAQPLIPSAVCNPKYFFLFEFNILIHFLICCKGWFIFICCCGCDLGCDLMRWFWLSCIFSFCDLGCW